MAKDPPTLKQGSEGDEVKALQNALGVRGYDPDAIDGKFGPATRNAVEEFQGDHDLEQDGIAGPKTWEALNVHTVQSGETLSEIAEEKLGRADSWNYIFDLNRALIDDPDEIKPGQILVLPLGD